MHQRMFAHLGMEVPIITRILISQGMILGVLLGLITLGTILKEFIVKNKKTTLMLNGIYLLIIVALTELITLGLMAPMQELIRMMEK